MKLLEEMKDTGLKMLKQSSKYCNEFNFKFTRKTMHQFIEEVEDIELVRALLKKEELGHSHRLEEIKKEVRK